MEYRSLGHSGLKISPLCLGTMMFGGQTEEAEAARIIAHARDAGINFIDTADVYNQGRSEAVTGRAIKHQRHHWVLATKLGNAMGEGVNDRGLSRRHVLAAAEASLRRLDTEVIDILYLHREDAAAPLEETVGALANLLRAGKIRYFGVSNFRAWRIAEICRLCAQAGIGRPVVSQPLYNALNRQIEAEHIPACAYFGLGVVPYSPLARGVLTGKYASGEAPEDSRAARQDKRLLETEFRRESLEISARFAQRAAAAGVTPGQWALAWVLANPWVSAAIAGPRSLAQWEAYLPALDYRFTPQDEALVDAWVAPGHPSTPGYNDPAYPLAGRGVV